jgi:hypothetical protein
MPNETPQNPIITATVPATQPAPAPQPAPTPIAQPTSTPVDIDKLGATDVPQDTTIDIDKLGAVDVPGEKPTFLQRIGHTMSDPNTLIGHIIDEHAKSAEQKETERQQRDLSWTADLHNPVLEGILALHEAPPLIQPANFLTADEQKQHPILTGAGEFFGGITSPENLLLMVASGGFGESAGLASKLVPRVASGLFAALNGKNLVIDQAPAFKKAWDAGDVAECQRIATEIILNLWITRRAAEHAYTGRAASVPLPSVERAVREYVRSSFRVLNEAGIAPIRMRAADVAGRIAERGEATLADRHMERLQRTAAKMDATKAVDQARVHEIITEDQYNKIKDASPLVKAKFVQEAIQHNIANTIHPEDSIETTATEDGTAVREALSSDEIAQYADKDPSLKTLTKVPSAKIGAQLVKDLNSDIIKGLRGAGQGEAADTMVRAAENHILRNALATPETYIEELRKGYQQLHDSGVLDVDDAVKDHAETVQDLFELKTLVDNLVEKLPEQEPRIVKSLLDAVTTKWKSSAFTILGSILGYKELGIPGTAAYLGGKWLLNTDTAIRAMSTAARGVETILRPEIKPQVAPKAGAPTIQAEVVKAPALPPAGEVSPPTGEIPTPVPTQTPSAAPVQAELTPKELYPAPEALRPPLATPPGAAGITSEAFAKAEAEEIARREAETRATEALKAPEAVPAPAPIPLPITIKAEEAAPVPVSAEERTRPYSKGYNYQAFTPEEQKYIKDYITKNAKKIHPDTTAEEILKTSPKFNPDYGKGKFVGGTFKDRAAAEAYITEHPEYKDAEPIRGVAGKWYARMPAAHVEEMAKAYDKDHPGSTLSQNEKVSEWIKEHPVNGTPVEPAFIDDPKLSQSLMDYVRKYGGLAQAQGVEAFHEAIDRLRKGVHEFAHAIAMNEGGMPFQKTAIEIRAEGEGAYTNADWDKIRANDGTFVNAVLKTLVGKSKTLHKALLWTYAAGPAGEEAYGFHPMPTNLDETIPKSDRAAFNRYLKALGFENKGGLYDRIWKRYFNAYVGHLQRMPNLWDNLSKLFTKYNIIERPVKISSEDLYDTLEDITGIRSRWAGTRAPELHPEIKTKPLGTEYAPGITEQFQYVDEEGKIRPSADVAGLLEKEHPQFEDILDVVKHLQDHIAGKGLPTMELGKVPTDVMKGRAVEAAIAEAKHQLAQEVHGLDWYKQSLKDAETTLKNYRPELKNNDWMRLYKAITAITSNGNGPDSNLNIADKVWRGFHIMGELPTFAIEVGENPGLEGTPIGNGRVQWGRQIGPRGFEALNQLMKDQGSVGKAMDWLTAKHPVDEVLKYASPDSHLTRWIKTAADENRQTWGALAWGPKVGRFMLNLNGNYDVLTADRWFNRTWNRWMGTPWAVTKDGRIRTEGGQPMLSDQTRSPEELRLMQESLEEVAKQLNMDVASVQAVLWHFEKQLYGGLGHEEPAINYDEAAKRLAETGYNLFPPSEGKAPISPRFVEGAEKGAEGVPTEDISGKGEDIVKQITKPEELTQHIQTGQPFSVQTAENPHNVQLSSEKNAVRQAELQKDLQDRGYTPIPATGRYEGVPQGENSFFVSGIPTKESIDLARKNEQAAVLTHDAYFDLEKNRAHPIDLKGAVFGEEAKTKPAYTSVNIGGKEVHFHVPVNFERVHPEVEIEARINATPSSELPKLDRTKIMGGATSQPHGLYHDAEVSEGNPWVRNSAEPNKSTTASNKDRILMVQFSNDLLSGITKGTSAADEASRYYDQLYGGSREGYARLHDFWEIPQWIGYISHMEPDADVYVVRDMAEAKKFLNEAGYKHVLFSSLDVNAKYIKDLANSYKGKFSVGGYADPKEFEGIKNIIFYPTMKAWANAAGIPYSEGVDYRHFQGSDVIPRLTMSQGCLHRCAFCTIPKKLDITSPEVVRQQADAIAKLGSKLVYLNDKTFGQASNYQDLAELNDRIKAKNPDFQGFVVQTTSTQLLKLPEEWLKKSGIKFVELGIETYNDPILTELHKPQSYARFTDQAIEKLRRLKIALIPNIIIGLPGETEQTYQNTLDFLKRNEDIISHANIYNLAIYKDSELGKNVALSADSTENDFNENVLEKSFHKNPEVHRTFAGQLYGWAMKLLGRKDPIATPDGKIAEMKSLTELPAERA